MVDPVLAKEPGHPLAAAVKIEGLLGLGERSRALDAYDAWFNSVRAEDVALLNRIAVAELEALQAEPLLQIDALVALSTQPGPRGTRARTQLTELATKAKPGPIRNRAGTWFVARPAIAAQKKIAPLKTRKRRPASTAE